MSETVLIVDDDPVQRRLLEAMVERFGYQALVAEGGDAAIAAARRAAAHRLRGARPGDARSRRPRRAGAHARGRPRHSRHRADRPWRHRQCGVGDARGRRRFRGQAGEPRAAAGLAAQCARHQGAGRRIAAAQAQPRRHAHHRRRDHPLARHASGAARGREGGGLRHPRADRGRIRRRQGTDRARHPRLAARAAPSRSSRSIAAPCRRTWSSRSCSATRRAPSPAPPTSTPASSSRPTAARCSSTRSANCRRRAGQAVARAAGGRGRAGRRHARPSRSMCASSPPPTAI